MAGRPPAWAKWVGGVLLAGAIAFVVFFFPFGSRPDPVAADWEVDSEADLDPATSQVPIRVMERGCASGDSAEGRIDVSIDYRADEIEFDVGVRPRDGEFQECPMNPITPHTVELDEPLGGRSIVGERPITEW